jgi:two-component system, NarL family, response regulator NreC
VAETSKQMIGVSMRRHLLTAREREVLRLLAEGNSAKKLAALLGLSSKTVEAHKFNLMRKLDVHNTAQLVRVALQEHIISLSEA